MKKSLSNERKNTKPTFAGFFVCATVLVHLFLLSSAGLQAQDRHWEILTLFGGNSDSTHADGDTEVTTMLHDALRGRIIIFGYTEEPDLPTTPDALEPRKPGWMAGYVAVFNADCSELVYCSYLGGQVQDAVVDAIFLDENRMLVLVGTNSSNMPTTGTAWNSTALGKDDAWFGVFSLDTYELLHAGYFGGIEDDNVNRLEKTADGGFVLTGYTASLDFPITPDAFQSRMMGFDAFIAVFDSQFRLRFSSYHGSPLGGVETACDGLAETENYIVFAGEIEGSGMPVSSDAYQNTFAGGWWDTYVVAVSKDSLKRVYSTYLGGSDFDRFEDILSLGNDRVALVGITDSKDFPVTENAWQSVLVDSGGYGGEIMLAVLDLKKKVFEQITFLGGNSVDFTRSVVTGRYADEISVAVVSYSLEFPFLPNKADNVGYRGAIIDFDLRTLQPVRGYPLVDQQSNGIDEMIHTKDDQILYCGITRRLSTSTPPPVRSTGHRTKRAGPNDVYIGKFFESPVEVKQVISITPDEMKISLYPQPATDILQLVADIHTDATWNLYDILGRLNKSGHISSDGMNARARIPVSDVRPGLYLFTVTTATQTLSRRVVISE